MPKAYTTLLPRSLCRLVWHSPISYEKRSGLYNDRNRVVTDPIADLPGSAPLHNGPFFQGTLHGFQYFPTNGQTPTNENKCRWRKTLICPNPFRRTQANRRSPTRCPFGHARKHVRRSKTVSRMPISCAKALMALASHRARGISAKRNRAIAHSAAFLRRLGLPNDGQSHAERGPPDLRG